MRWATRSARTRSASCCGQELGYSRRTNRKTLEGASHPDRDSQFAHINARACTFREAGQPVISVDTKKKELIGPFKNGGSDYRPKGSPEAVNVHDFADKTLGKVAPYGIYDPVENRGWVSLGIDHDTAAFAVNAIRTWHERIGSVRSRGSDRLLITADCGGSNGARVRLWKVELQKLADETGLTISVCHDPPGTSKWNTIEHRLFCHITQTWRGRPLISHAAVVDLIAATTTTSGLIVDCVLDPRRYAKGDQGERPGDGMPQHPGRRVPSGVELHHRSTRATSHMKPLFVRVSLAMIQKP